MLGAAILVAVVVAAFHVTEGREFLAVAERAKPWWLGLAVCLQAATYLAQGDLTFGALLLVFHAAPDLFRTGWFVESLLTEIVIALVVRTRRPFYRSRPGRVLLWSTVALIAVTVAIPYLPFIGVFGFVPLPGMLLITVTAITALYIGATELTKRRVYRGVL